MPPDAEVVDLYRQLQSVPQVAARLRLSETTTYRILERLGIVRIGRSRLDARKLTDLQEQEVAHRYRMGTSMNQLASMYGCTQFVIREALRRQQVKSRRRGGVVREHSPEQVNEMARLYSEGLSQTDIAIRFGVSQTLVGRILNRHGVRSRRSGVGAKGWKGGRTKSGDGYWLIWTAPDDPLASMRNRMGYVPEHRLVMARHLGRPLTINESVHHHNGDRADNRLENLQLRTAYHGRGVVLMCRTCGSRDIAAMPLTED